MANEIRIFFDSEFTTLTRDAKLISIGLVDQAGDRTFYAELSDTWRLSDAGDFAQVEVLPILQGGDYLMTMRDLSERLSTWIASFEIPVVLATDSLAWDWPWILLMLEERGWWPENLAKEPLLLNMNYLVEFDWFEEAIEKGFSAGFRRRHALDDARANRLSWFASGGDFQSKLSTQF
jgi:hypothetical protein